MKNKTQMPMGWHLGVSAVWIGADNLRINPYSVSPNFWDRESILLSMGLRTKPTLLLWSNSRVNQDQPIIFFVSFFVFFKRISILFQSIYPSIIYMKHKYKIR